MRLQIEKRRHVMTGQYAAIRELSMDEIDVVSGAGTGLSWRVLSDDVGLGTSNGGSNNATLTTDSGPPLTNKPGQPVFHIP
jgi:hypothetical protein